eukprot:98575-Rhodomonas_salina.1
MSRIWYRSHCTIPSLSTKHPIAPYARSRIAPYARSGQSIRYHNTLAQYRDVASHASSVPLALHHTLAQYLTMRSLYPSPVPLIA